LSSGEWGREEVGGKKKKRYESREGIRGEARRELERGG